MRFDPPFFAEVAKVQVQWKTDGKWYSATIHKAWCGLRFIRYGE